MSGQITLCAPLLEKVRGHVHPYPPRPWFRGLCLCTSTFVRYSSTEESKRWSIVLRAGGRWPWSVRTISSIASNKHSVSAAASAKSAGQGLQDPLTYGQSQQWPTYTQCMVVHNKVTWVSTFLPTYRMPLMIICLVSITFCFHFPTRT